MSVISTAVEFLGAVLVVVGVALFSPRLAYIIAGILLVAGGFALEERPSRRSGGDDL